MINLTVIDQIEKLNESNLRYFKKDIEKICGLKLSEFINENYNKSAVIVRINNRGYWKGLADDILKEEQRYSMSNTKREYIFDDNGDSALIIFERYNKKDMYYQISMFKIFMKDLKKYAEKEEEEADIQNKRAVQEREIKQKELDEINSRLKDL